MKREPFGDVLERIFADEPTQDADWHADWDADRDADLASLRDLFADLHAECANTPAPPPRADLAAILAGDTPRIAPAAATVAHRPLRARGLKLVRRRLVAAAVSVTAGLTMVSGLAAAQALPAPAQHVVEHALDHVGIHIEGDSPKPPVQKSGDAPAVAPTTSTRHSAQHAAPATAGTDAADGASGAATVAPPTIPATSPIPVAVPAGRTRAIPPPPPSLPIAIPTQPVLPL